jgi:hypothetical protein
MKHATLSMVAALAFAAGVSAQDKPNFAGKWKAAGSFTTWTITVEGSKMTVTQTVAGNSESTEYMLDGTPAKKTMEGPAGPLEMVRTSTWEGHVLVTTSQFSNGNAGVERRWIEPDGSMRVQNTLTMLQGKPAPPPPPAVAAGQVFKKIG